MSDTSAPTVGPPVATGAVDVGTGAVTESRPPRVPRLTALFPPALDRRLTGRDLALGTGAVLVGTVVSLLRTVGPLQTIWEEDARDILTDALNRPLPDAVAGTPVGYYLTGPRLLGELATFFPVGWAAAVLSISSAVVTALFALTVYVASGAHLPHRLARLLVAGTTLTAPVAENWLAEIYNRPVCLHFFGLYAMFWVLLWTPRSRAGRLAAFAVVAFTVLSTVVAVVFVPLALLRWWVRREHTAALLLALVAAGSALQLTCVGIGSSAGRGDVTVMRHDPLWALTYTVVWALPNAMLGYRASADLAYLPGNVAAVAERDIVVIAGAWLLVAAIVAVAWFGARRGLLRPHGPLAILAAVHSVGLLWLMIMANGAIAQRYLMPVEALLFTALVALLRPAAGVPWRRGGVLLAAFAVFVAGISAVNYRWDDTWRARSPQWTEQVRRATERCAAEPGLGHVAVRAGPVKYPSQVLVPCHDLRPVQRCVPGECAVLDPPNGLRAFRPTGG